MANRNRGVIYRVIYEVEEIRGECPLYKVGDKIVIDTLDSTEVINLEESTPSPCVRAMGNMWDHLVWQRGSDSVVAHLSGVNGECRIACPMIGPPYTKYGNVVFRIRREKLG